MTEHHNQAKSIVVGNAAPVENRPRMAHPATFSVKMWGGCALLGFPEGLAHQDSLNILVLIVDPGHPYTINL